jgi:hypothetical protein
MKEHTCSTYIVKSNNEFKKRVKSYNQIKMCICMDVWGIYMVGNLILLCSLKTYLSFFEFGNNFQENMGYLIHFSLSSLFSGGYMSTHFFMNNFCIATCLFSTTKLLRDKKNLEHLFGGYPIGYIFCVHFQCRSKIFLSESRWNDILLRLLLV